MELQMPPYKFCDQNLSPYEKTIFILAIAYGCNTLYSLNDNQINELSAFLEVDSNLLKKALKKTDYILPDNAILQFGDEIVHCEDFFRNDFFKAICEIFFLYKYLEDFFESTDEEENVENINNFNEMILFFSMANNTTATYESMKNHDLFHANIVYDSKEFFFPKNYIDLLELLLINDEILEYDKDILCVLTKIIKYELHVRINTLYLITICQIIKHSPCFDSTIKGIATELYNKFIFLLKNGRLIAINADFIPPDKTKHKSERTKKDHTARLQLLYGYENYDCYELRLDFPHKGQECVHFNNETPGGVSCRIFTNDEYEEIIKKYPSIRNCFISYDDRWALKERINCELSKETKNIYDEIIKIKSHEKAFFNNYSEEGIETFIQIIAKMLPISCRRHIDTDGTYARHCYNCDMIIRDSTLLVISYLSPNKNPNTKKFTDSLADKAFRYGIKPTKSEIQNFKQVKEIIDLAEKRII